MLVTPAVPQAGPEIEVFDPPTVDPATVFERSELRRNMEEAGKLKDKDGRVAHHIVPGGGPMNGRRDASPTQRKLDELKIDRNSVDNGTALSPEFHAKIHTKGYYDRIEQEFESIASDDDAKQILNKIRQELQ